SRISSARARSIAVMSILLSLLVALHLLCWAVALGLWVAAARTRQPNPGMGHALAGAMVLGIVLAVLVSLTGEPDHMKLGIKLLVGLVALVVGYIAQKKGPETPSPGWCGGPAASAVSVVVARLGAAPPPRAPRGPPACAAPAPLHLRDGSSPPRGRPHGTRQPARCRVPCLSWNPHELSLRRPFAARRLPPPRRGLGHPGHPRPGAPGGLRGAARRGARRCGGTAVRRGSPRGRGTAGRRGTSL